MLGIGMYNVHDLESILKDGMSWNKYVRMCSKSYIDLKIFDGDAMDKW